MKKIILLLSLIYLSTCIDHEVKAKNGIPKIEKCSEDHWFVVDKMLVWPEGDVVRGDMIRQDTYGTTQKDLPTKDRTVSVTLNGQEIFTDWDSLPSTIPYLTEVDFLYDYNLPADAAPGHYEIIAKWRETNDDVFLCTKVSFDLE